MILPILCVSLLTWPSSKCEPPVNSYLPPSNNGNDRPSTQYGPPQRAFGNDLGGNRPDQSAFGQSPQHNYLPPGQSSTVKANTHYGAPSSGNIGQDSPHSQERGTPSSQYGSTNQGLGQSSRLTNIQYSDLNNIDESKSNGQRPESSYGSPTSSVHSRNDQVHSGGFTPNQESAGKEGTRFQGGFRGQPASPSSSYGEPGLDGSGSGRGQNFGDGDTGEPAKYEFSYDVDDSQTGTKFGHSEQRDGDLATGEYNVVLPDGRKQVVEYEAGYDGFKPQIRYEGTPQVGSPRENGAYHGSSNGNGFPESNQGLLGSFGQYQDANTYPNSAMTQSSPGYPSGRPGNGNNEQGNGYPSGNSVQGAPGQNNPASNLRGLNGANQGYPRCSNRNHGGSQETDCSKSGAGVERSRNGYGGSARSEEGYPSGRPDGQIGTGY